MLRAKTPPPQVSGPARADPLPSFCGTSPTEELLPKVYIALVFRPTIGQPCRLTFAMADGTPPAPRISRCGIAIWRDRYALNSSVLSSIRMDLRVTRRPQAALKRWSLARGHYIDCTIRGPGLGTLCTCGLLVANDLWGKKILVGLSPQRSLNRAAI